MPTSQLTNLLFAAGVFPVLTESTPPATPAAGTAVVYAKTDGKLYSKDDQGTEYEVSVSLATERAAAVTLTNKRITPRVQSVSNASSVTPSADSDDCVDVTAQGQSLSVVNPTGTPTNFQSLKIRIKDNGTARALTWGSAYVAGGVSLPTTTVISKILTLGFLYNTANSLNKWQLVASAQED